MIQERKAGVVDWWDPVSGNGQLMTEDGVLLPVSYQDVLGAFVLYPGQQVDFLVISTPLGDRAARVNPLEEV